MSMKSIIHLTITCPDDYTPLEWQRVVNRIVFSAKITPRLPLGTSLKEVVE